MPPFPADSPARNLEEANSRLEFWLDSLVPNQSQSSRKVSPEQIAGLLSEVMRAGQWLQALPADKNPMFERALAAYRKNVERLRDLLPMIHSALLEERARLERERARVEAAAQWASRSRQTL